MGAFAIKKILVPVDFSETGQKVLQQAAMMSKLNQAEIVLFMSLENPASKSGPDYNGVSINNPAMFEKLLMEWASKNMEKIKEKLKKLGADKVSYKIGEGTPYKMIVKTAKDIKADLIMMGTHGVSGFREFSIGSNTARVVSESQCPVLSVQKKTTKKGFTKILVPFRDKPHAREGVDYAIGMAKIYGSEIQVLGISTDPADSAKRKLKLEAEQIKKIAEKSGIKTTIEIVVERYVAGSILKHAKERKADLIVLMADLDKASVSEYIIGPVIQQVVNHSTIPILSIRPVLKPKLLVGGADWSFWA